MTVDMSGLLNPSYHEHVMLLYDYEEQRDKIAIDYINEGLSKGQLAVYASVYASDALHMSKILPRITDHEQNINHGNLLILSLGRFYKRALAGDLEPFRDLRALLEEIVRERTAAGRSGEVVVVADCADTLSRNEEFDECVYVERWWQDAHLAWQENNSKITVICPHPRSVLERNPFVHYKQLISRQHSLTIRVLTR